MCRLSRTAGWKHHLALFNENRKEVCIIATRRTRTGIFGRCPAVATVSGRNRSDVGEGSADSHDARGDSAWSSPVKCRVRLDISGKGVP